MVIMVMDNITEALDMKMYFTSQIAEVKKVIESLDIREKILMTQFESMTNFRNRQQGNSSYLLRLNEQITMLNNSKASALHNLAMYEKFEKEQLIKIEKLSIDKKEMESNTALSSAVLDVILSNFNKSDTLARVDALYGDDGQNDVEYEIFSDTFGNLYSLDNQDNRIELSYKAKSIDSDSKTATLPNGDVVQIIE